jgi:SulP family sulfate permease
VAGITGALVLVPKAMAYAQLAGLPVAYGLYVALVPAIVGALWGSSRQLATGPVALISLMTAAALAPLAVPFSAGYVALALLLALMVGLIQLGLGLLRLGMLVNFIAHPVILGFMNAAAIIIVMSQLGLLLGLPKGDAGSFLATTWEALTRLPQTHLPTLAMSVLALALMLGLRRVRPLAQVSVLLAVALTIVLSVLVGYERKAGAEVSQVADPAVRALLQAHDDTRQRLAVLGGQAAGQAAELRALQATDPRAAAELRHRMALAELEQAELKAAQRERWERLSRLELGLAGPAQAPVVFVAGALPAGLEDDGRRWRLKSVQDGRMSLSAGGDVVGPIPSGLPSLQAPALSAQAVFSLLPAALVIALVGFMESIAMSRALAAKTRQRLDPDQELIGQGAANIAGSFFQSYPACGSFTGSAINLQAGARTGLAMVFNGVFVAVTLLLLTALLYHLPLATLGVIVLLAATSLLSPAALRHTWQASRADGVVAAVTFVATLVFAPKLDYGIAVGALLAVALYLWRTMKPRLAELGRHADGALRDVTVHPGLVTSPEILVLRFDDSLYFANAGFFEEQVLAATARRPQASQLLIVCNGINQMDASGEEVVRGLVERLRAAGTTVYFSGVKKQVRDVMRNTGLDEVIGADHLFGTADQALAEIYSRLGRSGRGELLPAAA